MPNNAIIPIGNLSGSITTGGLVPGLPIWTGEASGSIASFPDGSDNPVIALDFSIDPVQEGSGDPSPQNVRPISGWTGAEITKQGENLWNGKFVNSGFTEGDTHTTSFPYAGNNAMSCKSGTQYVASYNGTIVNIRYVFLDKNLTMIGSYTNGFYTSLAPSNAKYLRWRVQTEASDTDYVKCMIQVGTTPSEYRPYTEPIIYALPFKDSQGNPLTIYGGKVHIRRVNGVWSGEIEATHNKSTLNPQYLNQSTNIFTYIKADMKSGNAQNGLCDKFNTVSSSNNYGIRFGANNNTIYFYKLKDNIPEITDTASARQWFTNNPVDIYYPLSTPINYIINPPDIPNILTRLGYNNLWSDTGDIDQVIYMRDWNIALNMLWEAVFG